MKLLIEHNGGLGDAILDTAFLKKLKEKHPEYEIDLFTYFDNAEKHGDTYIYVDSRNGDKLYQSSINYLEDLDYYKGDPDGGYISYVWTDYLSAADLVKERSHLESEVREKLNIPFNPSRPGIKYEHSMGMGNLQLPDYILKTSQ